MQTLHIAWKCSLLTTTMDFVKSSTFTRRLRHAPISFAQPIWETAPFAQTSRGASFARENLPIRTWISPGVSRLALPCIRWRSRIDLTSLSRSQIPSFSCTCLQYLKSTWDTYPFLYILTNSLGVSVREHHYDINLLFRWSPFDRRLYAHSSWLWYCTPRYYFSLCSTPLSQPDHCWVLQ